jgi:hypothetical protein
MRTIVPGVRTLVLIAILSACSLQSNSQSIISGNGKYEIGLGFGPMFFLGDLGGNPGLGRGFIKDVNIPLVKLQKGIYASYYPGEFLGVRFALNHGVLEGNDAVINDKSGHETFRKKRNLNFESSIFEGYLAMEVYPTIFFERYEEMKGKLRPYIVGGVGVFRYNPKGEYIDPAGNRMMVELRPLRLEGQGLAQYPDRKPYGTMAINLPFGGGAKYYLKENMFIGLEILHRHTFTDYIDDVSTTYIDNNHFTTMHAGNTEYIRMANQLYYRENRDEHGNVTNLVQRPQLDEQRGDPKDKDNYFSTTVRIGWKLFDWNNPSMRQLRCPSFY